MIVNSLPKFANFTKKIEKINDTQKTKRVLNFTL